jgi:hypothetical protein
MKEKRFLRNSRLAGWAQQVKRTQTTATENDRKEKQRQQKKKIVESSHFNGCRKKSMSKKKHEIVSLK